MKAVLLKTGAFLGLALLLFVGFIGFSVWITATVSQAQGLSPCCAAPISPNDLANSDDFDLSTVLYSDLSTGQQARFSEQSKPFLMVFFANWCNSCVEEAPVLTALQAQGGSVLLVNATDAQAEAEAWRATHAPLLTAAHVPQDQGLLPAMKVFSLPTAILFDAGLVELDRWSGEVSMETLLTAWEQLN